VSGSLPYTLSGGRTRARRRRIKPPSPQFLIRLAFTLFAAAVAVSDIIDQRWAHAVLVLALTGYYWAGTIRLHEGRPDFSLRIGITVCAAYTAGIVLLDVAGIA
jgi:hypothetical protein